MSRAHHAFDDGPRQDFFLSGSGQHLTEHVFGAEDEQAVDEQPAQRAPSAWPSRAAHAYAYVYAHACASHACSECAVPATLPSASRNETGSHHELIEEAATASLNGNDDAQTAVDEQPAQRVRRPSSHDEPTSLYDLFEESGDELPAERRSRGVSIKKRKRSRKPGSQRHRGSGTVEV